jgi:hypothetical protein
MWPEALHPLLSSTLERHIRAPVNGRQQSILGVSSNSEDLWIFLDVLGTVMVEAATLQNAQICAELRKIRS